MANATLFRSSHKFGFSNTDRVAMLAPCRTTETETNHQHPITLELTRLMDPLEQPSQHQLACSTSYLSVENKRNFTQGICYTLLGKILKLQHTCYPVPTTIFYADRQNCNARVQFLSGYFRAVVMWKPSYSFKPVTPKRDPSFPDTACLLTRSEPTSLHPKALPLIRDAHSF